MTDLQLKAVLDVLTAGSAMRAAQKRYLVIRSNLALRAKHESEQHFDELLLRADYMVRHGVPPPEQLQLFP